MKKLALFLVCAFFCAPASLIAALKIGTVDMEFLFENFWKAKKAKVELDDLRSTIESELDLKRAEHQALEKRSAEQHTGRDFIPNAGATRSRAKIFHERENEIHDFAKQKAKEFAKRERGIRNELAEEITKVISAYAPTEGYDLIFDSSGKSFNHAPVVLRSAKTFDLTTVILTKLNAAQLSPAATPSSPAQPADQAEPNSLSPWTILYVGIAIGLLGCAAMLLHRSRSRPRLHHP